MASMADEVEQDPRPFLYDAKAKRVYVRAPAVGGGPVWRLEFSEHYEDDSRLVRLSAEGRPEAVLRMSEADFEFTDRTVRLRRPVAVELAMDLVHLKKFRGYLRGNVPTPDIPGPSLP